MAKDPFVQTSEFANATAEPEFEVSYEEFGTPDEYKDKTVIHSPRRNKTISDTEEAADGQRISEEKEVAASEVEAETRVEAESEIQIEAESEADEKAAETETENSTEQSSENSDR